MRVGNIAQQAAQLAELASEVIDQERQPGGLLDPAAPPSKPFTVAELRTPIESYLFARRNPAAAAAAPAIMLLGAFLLGRVLGERRR